MAPTNQTATPVICVSGVSKTFGRTRALDDVSLSIEPGIVGLIGPNGAGKTTLFECIAGLQPMDRGSVSLAGVPLRPADRSAHLFYVPDGIAPWPAETVRWALDFSIGFLGGVASRRDQIVSQLDLSPLLDQPIGTLSKGQRKRALLAVGLLTRQPVLLIDEPFDGLDLRQSRELGRTLRSHADAGRTFLLSIHQIADAARVCDRFVLLSAGRVCGQGTLDELMAVAARHAGQTAPPASLEEVFLALT